MAIWTRAVCCTEGPATAPPVVVTELLAMGEEMAGAISALAIYNNKLTPFQKRYVELVFLSRMAF
jgi:hypothetical protein